MPQFNKVLYYFESASVMFTAISNKNIKNKKRNLVEANSSSRFLWNVGKLLKVILKSRKSIQYLSWRKRLYLRERSAVKKYLGNMKNYKSFHQEFGTECMRVCRPNSDNFYSWTMLLQWNPGFIQINGKIPIRFNGARISCVSVFFHSSLIFVSQLSGRLLSVQVKIKAFYSYMSELLSVFSQ